MAASHPHLSSQCFLLHFTRATVHHPSRRTITGHELHHPTTHHTTPPSNPHCRSSKIAGARGRRPSQLIMMTSQLATVTSLCRCNCTVHVQQGVLRGGGRFAPASMTRCTDKRIRQSESRIFGPPKMSSPIRTSVGQPIFSEQCLDSQLVIAKFTHFSTL